MMLHRHFEGTNNLESIDTTNPDDPLYIPPKEEAKITEADEIDEQPRRGRPLKK